ncbi:MAG: glycosyl hydrolase [Bacteroidota bacterium]|nr:glycosyl hydrolase [Bacteroidota bacterium]
MKGRIAVTAVCVLFTSLLAPAVHSQGKKQVGGNEKKPMQSRTFDGLSFRSIGPALTSGRIIDIAVHPSRPRTWYIGVACGGVWKTTNGGTTWQPVFDGQKSFSIGCVAVDPMNPHTVWVGTGENNSQRSVSYGDGVYRSDDGGTTWKCMGLKRSEHIGRIVIHPRNSNIVYVAVQGPLWAPGGDRGLYKTTDGGKTWKAVLTISENTGVTDVVMDPRDPEILYAAAYQRRRHVWTLINGGPEAGIFRTRDGGQTWDTLRNGIPNVDLGRIGLALAPSNPDIVYATIEAANGQGGFFRSTDRGATWEKRNSFVSDAAQYYQELVCDPANPDRVYNFHTILMVTDDGGKTFRALGNRHRHVDDHALWIDPENTDHLLVGGDGGLYESYDRGETWRFFENLPITQFYRVSVDDTRPFYFVYGGTQDNNSLGGPSRTLKADGIMNEDWFHLVGGDGFEPQVDPSNPNIIYAQWQYGGLVRFDRASGERIPIQPKPRPGEPPYRWNWDSPLLISPHSPTRLYFCSNVVFRSDDRGDSWRVISPDLSRGIDRNTLPVMGRVWGPDAVAKNASTSFYGNIVAFDESPLVEGLLVAGTDDGLIHISEDGGANWRKIVSFPGIPDRTYVSCVRASRHEPRTVYACFDNHKMGDFRPYILMSPDLGKTWLPISGDLPDEGSVYTIEEDHVLPNLLFAGTEFGVFFTPDRGKGWVKLKGGLPPAAVRDIAIQRRENDLVVATFGRGIYILDDYAPLRSLAANALDSAAFLFPVKDAWMYIPSRARQHASQGETFFTAPNPPFGATFTYFIRDPWKSKKEMRREAEREAVKKNMPFHYPTIEELRLEDEEKPPVLLFDIRNGEGKSVRRLTAPYADGIHRITWDLRYADMRPVREPGAVPGSGMPVTPGPYSVTLLLKDEIGERVLAGPVSFTTKVLPLATLPAADSRALDAFHKRVAEAQRVVLGIQQAAYEMRTRLGLIENALEAVASAGDTLRRECRRLMQETADLIRAIDGDPTYARHNENGPVSVVERLTNIASSRWTTTSTPTVSHREELEIVERAAAELLSRMEVLLGERMPRLEAGLEEAGAPWTPGRLPSLK